MSQTSQPLLTLESMRHGDARDLIPVRDMFGADIGPMVAVAAHFEPGEIIHSHWHDWPQLVFALNGVMSVITDEGFWVVPPNRAVWIPAFKKHSFRISSRIEMRTVYMEENATRQLLSHCCVLQASALLRELVIRLLTYPNIYTAESAQTRLAAVIVDEIHLSPTTPLHVPRPTQPRLLTIAEHITSNPADNRSLAQWGSRLGASERTLARQFQQDTGMSFAQWRQQVRLVLALQMLAERKPVTQVAIDLGYESPSAFISMFRKSLGTTPSRYFA
ncbi:MAG: helix-turn-helix transcriptional regulator [Spongiibacteraceae bacterium]